MFRMLSRPNWIMAAGMALVAGLVIISGESFWIDEGNTAYKAAQPSIATWYQALLTERGSDSQMPGYMLYAWAWHQLGAQSEWALRLSNLPWLIFASVALRKVRYGSLALLISPFVLYYANEFRPYVMQIAAGAWITAALFKLEEDWLSCWRAILGGALILCLSSLTGVIWALGAGSFFICARPRCLRERAFWTSLAFAAPVFLGLGWYYALTLMSGNTASPMASGLVVSLGASLYELMGLTGLGPGRIELRANPASVIRYGLPVGAGAMVLGAVYAAGIWAWLRVRSPVPKWPALVGLGVPVGILFALVFLKDFRVLARHFAPAAALVACLLATSLEAKHLPANWNLWSRIVAIAAIVLCLASSLSLRLAERHRKDDFRRAASLTKEELNQGHSVLWAADKRTANFYGLGEQAGKWRVWMAPQPLPPLEEFDLVVFSKPDVVDQGGLLAAELKQHRFTQSDRLQAFTIWKKSP